MPPRVTIEYIGQNNYKFYVNGKDVDSFAGVERTLIELLKGKDVQNTPVLLHCDKRVAYDEAVKMLLMAQGHGFRLLLATKPGQ